MICREFGVNPISIHALREEGDLSSPMRRPVQNNFYPRPPRGGRQVLPEQARRHEEISIHALREEGDLRQPRKAYCLRDFYPRPPRGGRPPVVVKVRWYKPFLSTPSARRATHNAWLL